MKKNEISPVDAPASAGAHGRPLSAVLLEMAADTSRERISVADLLVAMQDRALAALLLLFALPNVVPMPPGTSAVLGAPLLFLAAQLAVGRGPWLPGFITRRSMLHTHFAAMIRRVVPWLERAERLMKPRLAVFARPPFEYVIGVACLLMAVVIFLPIPFGNMLPALSVCLMALGVLERDGLWVMVGLLSGAASITLVWGMFYALARSAVFVILHAFGGA